MIFAAANDPEYLAARLHARRGQMAEGERLEALCRLRTLAELSRAVRLDTEYQTAAEFQRRLVGDLIRELGGWMRHLDGAGGQLYAWTLVRFQVENMKVLVRGLVNQTPPETVQPQLAPLPPILALDLPALTAARSLADLAAALPPELPCEYLQQTLAMHHTQAHPFILEAALDSGYFQELLERTRRLSGEEQAVARSLMLQEANWFQFMLATRGRFLFDTPPELLLAHRLAGINEDWFRGLLTAPDLTAAAKLSVGMVFDEMPVERGPADAVLEALAWKRLLRLGNSAFRRDHMGLGAALGYAVLRRAETANLITLSEGIRLGVEAEEVRRRMIPRQEWEVAHV